MPSLVESGSFVFLLSLWCFCLNTIACSKKKKLNTEKNCSSAYIYDTILF